MRSRGIGRAFIVPTATAGLIIWIIYFFPHADQLQLSSEKNQTLSSRLPSTAARGQAWTLFDEERRYGQWTPVPVAIPQRFGSTTVESATNGEISLPELSSPPAPREPIAEANLRAPLMLDDLDLAGLRDSDLFTAQSVSKKNAASKNAANTLILSKRSKTSRAGAWPETPEILARLSALANEPLTNGWATEIKNKLRQLQVECLIGDERSADRLSELQEMAAVGMTEAEASTAPWPLRSAWLQACYSIQRRIEVWRAVNQCRITPTHQFTASVDHTSDQVPELVDAVRKSAIVTGDVAGWNRFLLLEQIQSAAKRAEHENRKLVAQRMLSRVDSFPLNAAQTQWVNHESVKRLTTALRPWATEPTDLQTMLEELEIYEAVRDEQGAARIAVAIQTLRFAEQPEIAAVATRLNDHYRNANLRISLHADMLERFLPTPEPKTAPVQQNILGAIVRGNSITESKLGIRLVPTQGAWRILLDTKGSSRTRTVSTSGPAEFKHQGVMDFDAATEIRVDRDGLFIHEPKVDVHATNRLRSVASDFDALPVIGPLVRSIALSQYEDSKNQANSIAKRLAERQIAENIDQELRASASNAERTVIDRMIGPLAGMNLHPMVVDMQNSDQRLQVRYRVAGNYQLAANSPRPRAWSDSIFSVQMHESTINNLLEQSLDSDTALTVADIWRRAVGPFGKPAPADLPDNIKIAFSPSRPIEIRCEANRMTVALHIVALQIEDHLFRNFNVQVAYRPEIDGMQARLVRDGVIQVSGERLGTRERLPIRVIFNKVFHEQRAIPVLAPELAQDPRFQDLKISQLEMRDGWFALALAPAVTRVASRP